MSHLSITGKSIFPQQAWMKGEDDSDKLSAWFFRETNKQKSIPDEDVAGPSPFLSCKATGQGREKPVKLWACLPEK